MQQLKRRNACDNLNHRRAQVPVRNCPMCGGVVNQLLVARQCTDAQHAVARRQRSVFCVDCGTRLVSDG